MYDRIDQPLHRDAFFFIASKRCPFTLGQTGFWRDAGDGTHKLRQANGTDVVIGVPSDDAVSFEARLYSASPLATCVYSNGTNGQGATLTKSTNGALAAIDGVTPAVGDVILVGAQASALQNGLYLVFLPGSASTPWVLTRISSMDTSADFVAGYVTAVEAGTTYADARVEYTGAASPTLGTTALTFAVISQHAQAAEQIAASGPLSPSIPTTVLDIVGTQAYSLANGTAVGQRKRLFCRAATSTPVGVVTPASPNNFATLTFGAANETAELEWNGSSWDLVGVVGAAVA